MTPQELNTKWEQLAYQQESHPIPTVVNRQVNRAVIEFANWYEDNTGRWSAEDTQKYTDLYNVTNDVMEKTIAHISQTALNVRGADFTVTGKVVRRKPKKAKDNKTYLYIFAALIAIVGTIGILKSKKGMRAFSRV